MPSGQEIKGGSEWTLCIKRLLIVRPNQSYLSRDGSNGQTSLATPAAEASKTPKVAPHA